MTKQRTGPPNPKDLKRYKNVNWNRSTGDWIGCKQYKNVRLETRAKTALKAARGLNEKCRLAGAPVPNPGIDIVTWDIIERELKLEKAEKEMIQLYEDFMAKWEEKGVPLWQFEKLFQKTFNEGKKTLQQ